jgi:hypothetical protein
MNVNLDSKYSNSRINHLDINVINSGITELKTIKLQNLKSVCQILKDSSYRINSNLIPAQGGVYCFWWTGSKEFFINNINRKLDLAGPNGRRVEVEISDSWLNYFQDEICLYVGKNSSSIKKRLSGHLRLKSQRDHCCSLDIFKEKPKTTSVQLKRGLEELFINEPDIRNSILENVGMSYFELSGDENSVNRFYLEDKAIGEFYPILNVDIER